MYFTTIYHPVRKHFGLSCNEYCIADMIYHLSNNPAAPVTGWCSATRQYFADAMGITRRSVIDIMKTLEEKGLVERNSVDMLRTTQTWYDAVTGCEESSRGVKKVHTKKRCEESSQGVKKVHGGCEESSQEGVKTFHTINKEDNKIDNRERESGENSETNPLENEGQKAPPGSAAPPPTLSPYLEAHRRKFLNENQGIIEKMSMQFRKAKEAILEKVDDYFLMQDIAGAHEESSYKEVRYHLTYWIKEQYEREQRNERFSKSSDQKASTPPRKSGRKSQTGSIVSDDDFYSYIHEGQKGGPDGTS